MGQALMKLGSSGGSEERKEREIGPIIESCYDTYIGEANKDDFYHAVCKTVEEINRTLGSTQFRVPKKTTLEEAFQKHHKGKGKDLTKEEFQKILQAVILDTGFTGIAAKDILFYIYGVPASALFIKQRILPKVIPNEVFIPCVTSATVFLLAKLNKI